MNPTQDKVSRRLLVAGAGVVGAAAAAVALLPLALQDVNAGVAPTKPMAGKGGQLSEHVKRYDDIPAGRIPTQRTVRGGRHGRTEGFWMPVHAVRLT